MRLRQLIAMTLMMALFIITGRPASAALSNELRVTYLSVQDENRGKTVEDGATISRLTDGVVIGFENGPWYPATESWFEVRDSQGRDPGWTPKQYGSAPSLTLQTGATPANPLPPNETYTITIKGGPDGVRGYYTPLAADYTFSLTTEGTDWSITGVAAIRDRSDTDRLSLAEGDLVDQGLDGIALQTTHQVDPESLAGNVTLVDSQGSALDWTPAAKDGILLTKGAPLQPDQTYTIQVKGGPEGVKSILGDPLPQDYSLSFRTQAGVLKLYAARAVAQGAGYAVDLSDVIQRNTYQISFQFDRVIDCSTLAEGMQVTDSRGVPVNWEMECRSQFVTFTMPHFAPGTNTIALPRNETYTFRFKAGVLKSSGGTDLEADVVRTVTTEDKPSQITYWQSNEYEELRVQQTEVYRLWAEAGAFRVQISARTTETEIHVTLQDVETGEVILSEWFSHAYNKTITLPKTGSYDLYVGPNYLNNLWVEGTELNLSLERPVISFPEMAPFVTKNQAFSVQATLLDPTLTAKLQIWLNDQKLGELIPTAGNGALAATIDPATLADGIYDLSAYAEGNGTENAAWQSRVFLVDRQDTYSDVGRTHWARPYIEVMSHLEILAGKGDGLFNPAKPVRRDEFAKMLAETLGLPVENPNAKPFVDMKEDWAEPYLQAVYEAGLMKGEVVGGQRYFYPAKTISRAEAAVTLARVMGADQIDLSGYVSPLKDWHSVPTWARSSVAVLNEMKWINGFPDGSFGPWANLNRDQAAKILANFLDMK